LTSKSAGCKPSTDAPSGLDNARAIPIEVTNEEFRYRKHEGFTVIQSSGLGCGHPGVGKFACTFPCPAIVLYKAEFLNGCQVGFRAGCLSWKGDVRGTEPHRQTESSIPDAELLYPTCNFLFFLIFWFHFQRPRSRSEIASFSFVLKEGGVLVRRHVML
jgi:hypothetical protein